MARGSQSTPTGGRAGGGVAVYPAGGSGGWRVEPRTVQRTVQAARSDAMQHASIDWIHRVSELT